MQKQKKKKMKKNENKKSLFKNFGVVTRFYILQHIL